MVVLLSTSPGANGGATALKAVSSLVGWWGADLVDAISIGSFFEAVDADNLVLTREEEVVKVNAALQALIERSDVRLAS